MNTTQIQAQQVEPKTPAPEVIRFITGMVNFHLAEGDIQETDVKPLLSFWMSFIHNDWEGMHQVLAAYHGNPGGAAEFMNVFANDNCLVNLDWGTNYRIDGDGQLHLLYKVAGREGSLTNRGSKRYMFIFSTRPDVPVRLYMSNWDDRRMSARDALSGYQNDIGNIFTQLRDETEAAFLRLIRRDNNGFYSPYTNLSPGSWASYKERRDLDREQRKRAAERKTRLAAEPGPLKLLRKLGRSLGFDC